MPDAVVSSVAVSPPEAGAPGTDLPGTDLPRNDSSRAAAPADDTPSPGDELTVGQLAARSGVAVSALHFYEREGLLTSRRTPGNQRRYPRETLRRVAFVRASQRVGIPLARIRDALATLPDDRTPTAKDWHRLSVGWHADLDARIEQLTRLRDHLTDCIGCGCLSLRRCVLVNPHDELGEEGPGPRTLLVEGLDD